MSITCSSVVHGTTTLATNDCVEDRGGNARLIFFGGPRGTIDKYGAEYGLPPSDEMLIQESYTKFSGEIEREPDWELFRRGIERGFDGVGIILYVHAPPSRAVANADKKR